MERTLAILKPDCVQKKAIGQVLSRIEASGFKILALKTMRLQYGLAAGFYEIHKEKSFYPDLVAYMSEGPVVIAILEKENAIQAWRDLMGATNPKNAAPGTIRKDLAEDVSRNMVHGSDSPENAAREIAFFFSESELIAEKK
jgi:nucleoside-diphosphate kinase